MVFTMQVLHLLVALIVELRETEDPEHRARGIRNVQWLLVRVKIFLHPVHELSDHLQIILELEG